MLYIVSLNFQQAYNLCCYDVSGLCLHERPEASRNRNNENFTVHFASELLTLTQNNLTLGNKITSTFFFFIFYLVFSPERLIFKLLCQQHVSASCTNREIYDKKTYFQSPNNHIIIYGIMYIIHLCLYISINPRTTRAVIIPCSRSVKESLHKSRLT